MKLWSCSIFVCLILATVGWNLTHRSMTLPDGYPPHAAEISHTLISTQSNPDSAQALTSSVSPNESEPVSQVNAPTVQTQQTIRQPNLHQANLEANSPNRFALNEISTTEQAKEFLKKKALPEVATEFATGGRLSESSASTLNGRFFGRVDATDTTLAGVEISMELDAKIAGQALQGKNLITVSRAGQLLGRSDSSGSIQQYKAATRDPDAVLIEILRGNGFLQIYSFKNLDTLMGNVYYKAGPDQFKIVGTITFNRS